MLTESILVVQIAMITLKFFQEEKNPTKLLLIQQCKIKKKKLKILPCTKNSEVPSDVLHMGIIKNIAKT